MAQKVTVMIVDAQGNKLRDQPPFKLPVSSDQLIATFKAKGDGTGELLDADGDEVPLGTDMQAETYTYRVTGGGVAGGPGTGAAGTSGAEPAGINQQSLVEALQTGLTLALQPWAERLETAVGQLESVADEAASVTRAASKIKEMDLERFRAAARVIVLDEGPFYEDVIKQDPKEHPEEHGFEWQRGPGSLSEAQHAQWYRPRWAGEVRQAAVKQGLQWPEDITDSNWRDALNASLKFRHRDCPFPLSSKNDLVLCLGSTSKTAIFGVEMKKDLDDAALLQGEVEDYVWERHVPFAFMQVVTDLCRGGAAIWCESTSPEGITMRRRVFSSMEDLYDFVAIAICSLPANVVKMQPNAQALARQVLPNPDRIKFFTFEMETIPEEYDDKTDDDDHQDDDQELHMPDHAAEAGPEPGSSRPAKKARGSDQTGGRGGRKAGGAVQRRPAIGPARSAMLARLLDAMCANENDVANLRDVE